MFRGTCLNVAIMSCLLAGFAAADDLDDGTAAHNPGIASQHGGDGLPLIPKLHWDMRREQIKLAFPDVQDMWTKRGFSEKPNFRQLKIRRYEISGCEFELTMDFFNDPDDSLTEITGDYKGSDASICIDRIKAKFFGELGSHPRKTDWSNDIQGHTEMNTSLSWSGAVTGAVLLITTRSDSGHLRFGFSLLHEGAPGTYVE